MLSNGCPKGTFYEIQRSDSLVNIARKFNISLSKLLEANPYFRPNAYIAGQIIIIPESTEACLYEVGATDGLADVLRKFNMSAAELRRLNPDIDIFAIQPGDIIMINENTKNTTYTIENGETLSTISEKFKISEVEILKANPHLRPLEFSAGRRVIIPLN